MDNLHKLLEECGEKLHRQMNDNLSHREEMPPEIGTIGLNFVIGDLMVGTAKAYKLILTDTDDYMTTGERKQILHNLSAMRIDLDRECNKSIFTLIKERLFQRY